MEVIYSLIRNANENCYCYGSIWKENQFVHDTLEFGASQMLPVGAYSMKICKNEQNNDRFVGIFNESNEKVSEFVKSNEHCWKNIKLRINNNKICIGLKVNDSLLVMAETSSKFFGLEIHGYETIGTICKLIIIETQQVQKSNRTIEIVTNY